MTTVAAVAGVGIVGALLLGLSNRQKTVIEQGKLSTRVWQGSEYGGDIPRMYGTVALEGSQIVWLEHNKLKEKVKKKKSGGKGGGGSTTTKIYTYYATFALMLCQGEVAGVRRIWCGDKLIYNAGSDDLETIIASNQAAKGWKLYRGTDDQLPDPRYEADVGVGNAPAFRGYTYIAFYDFALAEYSNTLQAAQFKVELVQSLESSGSEEVLDRVISGSSGNFFTSNLSGVFCRIYNKDAHTITSHTIGASYVSDPAAPNFGYAHSWHGEDNVFVNAVLSELYVPGDFGGTLPLIGFDISNSNWTGFRNGNRFYVYSVSSSNVDNICATGGSAPTVNLHGEGNTCICNGLDCLIALTANKIRKYSLDDLSLISEVSYAPDPIPVGSPSYASFDDGVIYIYSFGNTILQGFNLDTGEQVYYTDDLPPLTSGTAGIPGFVTGGVLVRVDYSSSRLNVFNIHPFSAVKPTLASIIASECSLSSLINALDIDVSDLDQQVTGYRVSGGAIRSVIEPLQGAYPFDVVPSGYKIKFVPRGLAPVVTIPWEDLAAANGDEIGDSLPYSREMDSQLPQKVTITALSSTREYGAATQSYERMNTSAVNVEQRDIPLVLSDDEIAQMAEKLLFLRWLERDDYSGPSLPPTYLALEPSDVVLVKAKFGDIELRLTEVNYEEDGRLTCKAKANSAPLYTSRAVGAPGPGPSGEIPVVGDSLMILADAPMIYETFQNEPGISTAATGYTDGWPGGVLVRSADNGQTWVELQGYVGKGTIGFARNALSANSCALIYEGAGLQVDILSGELESITRDQMIAGENIALYGADQRWEVIRFRDATLQSDGSYILTGIIRGDKGTEWATGLHQPGDSFVLAGDPDNIFVGMPVETLGIGMAYRAVTAGGDIDSTTSQSLTYRGVNLKPLSPTFPRGVRNGSGDLTATIQRRTRFTNSWWITGVSGPVGEVTEAYEADVISGGTVKRTLTSTNGTFSYPAAQQVTDFGSVQASITIRFYQMSATVGRGYALEATL